MNGTKSHAHEIELTVATGEPRRVQAASGVLEAARSSVPVLIGATLAVAIHWAVGLLGADTAPQWLAALAGVSCWLYVGSALGSSPGRALFGVLAAVVLFALAVAWPRPSTGSLAIVFLGHALVSVARAWLGRREEVAASNVWLSWSAFNGSIAALTLLV